MSPEPTIELTPAARAWYDEMSKADVAEHWCAGDWHMLAETALLATSGELYASAYAEVRARLNSLGLTARGRREHFAQFDAEQDKGKPAVSTFNGLRAGRGGKHGDDPRRLRPA